MTAFPQAPRWTGRFCVLLALLLGLLAPACQVAGDRGLQRYPLHETGAGGPRVLGVVAHPDDEVAFAATMYATATLLGGSCDLLVITNGEGGFKYSTLAEPIYGMKLTDPDVGRRHLPSIRRDELLDGCDVLRLRQVLMLAQRDSGYTLEVQDVLADDADVWDLGLVAATLDRVLAEGDYDFVLTHLPVPETHGHHKAATLLTLQAVERLPVAQRPVVLGAGPTGPAGAGRPAGGSEPTAERAPFTELAGYPRSRIRRDAGPYAFDRTTKFGHEGKLDYQIVVNWAIAEHKSQGTMQRAMNLWDKEVFWLYELPVPRAAQRAATWFGRLAAGSP
ncbi:MAG: PIG-L family deacetylase [Planctomycetota bacterium]